MIKFGKSVIFKIIYVLVGYVILFQFKNFELALILIFLPYLISSILSYQKFEKSIDNENHIMLSKSNFDYWNFGFVALIVIFCISDLNTYTAILLILSLIYLFFEYTVSKRRIIFIDKNGIDEFGKDKHREMNEITSLEIYPNNVEFRFNEYEILQINQNELVRPNWDDFVIRITELKTYANKMHKS
ncbi:hypothetical protein GCM10009430_45810 [Aquimarina litoralis]|uniref:Uncharacterized protein n=1 Tax=Aquimarina litoralis TaxID=584605 RepID=A0ABN1J8Y8_9FLAO